MSIASDTLQADLTLELRRDLAATRNALQRSEDANASLRRRVERLEKAVRTIAAAGVAHRLNVENIVREVL